MKETLRVITAGSVDDGKSTLIGRLLYDAKVLTRDQLDILEEGQETNTANRRQDAGPDFAALTDGLLAEKEQGITIDVAYRYFTTQSRRYILADCPGHEAYTRNMVTGASTADVAIILIDPTKLDFTTSDDDLLLIQTKRHSTLLLMLGVRHIVVAVNKMDAIEFDEKKFQQIAKAYSNFFTKSYGRIFYNIMGNPRGEGAQTIQPLIIPLSAKEGDNIVDASTNLQWYRGKPLLQYLDDLVLEKKDGAKTRADVSILPVQYVLKDEKGTGVRFRGYQGRVEHGTFATGQAVTIFPSGAKTSIKAIYNTVDGATTSEAKVDEVVTIQLTTEVDVSRGDYIIHDTGKGKDNKNFNAIVCWLDKEPFNQAIKYKLKHTTKEVQAKLSNINILNLNKIEEQLDEVAGDLQMNSIAKVAVKVSDDLHASTYDMNRSLGAFILIDPTTYHTVAAGVITP